MSIPLRCPTCDTTFEVNDELAGGRASCPGCKATMAVPGGSADDEPVGPTPARGPWMIAGAAGILAAAALLFAILSYSRARTIKDSLASAEQRADVAATAAEEMKARLADVERKAKEADAGREDVNARLAVAERKAEAAVAAREDLKKHLDSTSQPLAPPAETKDKPTRRLGTVTLANGTRRAFTTLSGGRFAAGNGRADAIQRAPGELVLYPAGERLREVLVPVDSIQSVTIGSRVEKDPDADDAERLFSVQVTGTDGKQTSWTVEAPLTIYIHWAEGRVVEQFLNRDLLGMSFTFETETAKSK